jgi:hypothetical protein
MATFYAETDLPLAEADVIVQQELDYGVKLDHKVFAGTRVPPYLVDAWREATGAPLTEAEIKQQEEAGEAGTGEPRRGRRARNG